MELVSLKRVRRVLAVHIEKRWEKSQVYFQKRRDRRPSFLGREGDVRKKKPTRNARVEKKLVSPPLVAMRPVAPYIALYRIARQISACIPTLSAPAA